MNRIRYVGLATLFALAACHSTPSELEPAPTAPPAKQALGTSSTGLVHVSELQAAAPPLALLGDDPAAANVPRLRAMIADGSVRSLSLGVYSLAAPADPAVTARGRAAELRLAGTAAASPPYATISSAATDGWQLRINGESGAEWFVWRGQFHTGHGEASRLTDPEYVRFASAWLQSSLATPTRGMQLYPYKVHHYMNAEADDTGPTGSPRTYQIAIAFNTAIDDLPVIGGGGKVAIHMKTDGTIVEHEAVLRPLAERAVTITGDEIVGPDAALATASASLRARGVDPSNYRLDRSEVGYLTRGRDGVEGLLAPHYSFIFTPLDGRPNSKKLVELVPAFTNATALRLVDADQARDEARKDALVAKAAPPDRK